MSRFQAMIEDSYPDLIRALMLADELDAKRDTALLPEIEVFALMGASTDEGLRAEKAIMGGADDLRAALMAHGKAAMARDSKAAAALGVAIVSTLLRSFQLGVWLGQGHLMSLKDRDLRKRLEALTQAAKRKARDANE